MLSGECVSAGEEMEVGSEQGECHGSVSVDEDLAQQWDLQEPQQHLVRNMLDMHNLGPTQDLVV